MAELGKGILDAITKAFGSLVGGGGGEGGGFLSGIPIIGGLFAEGGMVPSGFPNDSFPARLTSGEFVIDRSLTDRFTKYLDRMESKGATQETQQQQSQMMTVNLVVSEEKMASVMLDLNRKGFRLA
jgi:hypothetical protein